MAPNDDMNAMVAYDTCVSNDTDGYLLSTHATADLIKGLKIDPRSQIAVASIQGAPQPYVVHWTAPRATDMSCGKASCPWPEITHSCTAPDASVADPGVRTAQFVQEFGDQGLLLSICDGSFGPSLERVAASIGTLVAPFCLEHSFADDPTKPGLQPDCNATLHQRDATSAFVDTPLPACADNGGAAPCWSLTKDVASCAGSSVHVTQAAGKAMPGDIVTFDCIPCRSDPPDPATCY